ncbi:hypothetical protein ACFQJ7_09780 [Halovenus rubra]|uniref:Uncharacterized protein n=2 Tax=Halovenus rubra TaxID=869890 RepID=A0ACC7DWK3_9EURY|nr:hypothetical protein [Halovenus rubra]
MKKSDENTLESIARELYHDAQYIGTDGDDAVHFWSLYHQAVVVIDDEMETYELADTPLSTLGDWTEHTEAKRGEWDELLVADGGMAGVINTAMEAGA